MNAAERASQRADYGPRTEDRGGHYALCNSSDCPCYQEGSEDAIKPSTDDEGCDPNH